MKAFWITPLLLASTIKAQDIPPLAPLRGDVASLADTMKFIQEKLPGKVNYMVYGHDNLAGTDLLALRRTFLLSDVTTDANKCSVNFHQRFDNGKNKIVEGDIEILLKQVKEVSLSQMEVLVQQANAKADHPEITSRIEPPIALVIIKSAPNRSTMFNFYSDSLAERVSLALKHAVSLCGGGKPETF